MAKELKDQFEEKLANPKNCILVLEENGNFYAQLSKSIESEDEVLPDHATKMAALLWLLSQKERTEKLVEEFLEECGKTLH